MSIGMLGGSVAGGGGVIGAGQGYNCPNTCGVVCKACAAGRDVCNDFDAMNAMLVR